MYEIVVAKICIAFSSKINIEIFKGVNILLKINVIWFKRS